MLSIFVDGTEYRFINHAYAISRSGKVLRKLEPFKPCVRPDGYARISGILLHRAVAFLWLPARPGAKHIHHKDEDKLNNTASNLEWVTPKEHIGDRHHGVFGKYKRTKATKAKLRIARTGSKDKPDVAKAKRKILSAVGPKRPCEINGIKYRSVRHASIVLGIHVSTVRMRCLSKNFPNYKIWARTAG